MKQILDYFIIDGEVGGNQDWFRNVVMHIGGCAAATACDCCIYFAKYKGKKNLYPFDAENLSKEDYIQFSMKMKPYLRPRMSGVNKVVVVHRRLWKVSGRYRRKGGIQRIFR